MKAIFLFLLFLSLNLKLSAQSYEGTRATLDMVNTEKQIIKAVTKNAVVIYSTNTNELIIKLNIAEIITGNRIIDSTLQTLPINLLILKGNPNINIDQLNDENNTKEYKIEGQAGFGEVQQTFSAVCNFISLANKTDLKNTKLNFEVRINPNVFSLPVIADLCNYELRIKIDEGRINMIAL